MSRELPAGPGFGQGPALAEAHRFSHEAMATVFEVLAVHPDARYAAQAAQAAFAVVDQLEQLLSRFTPNSDVSRINHLDAGQAARVSPWTMECLEIAWQLHGLTGGAFDVSIGSGLERFELWPEEPSVRAREGGARLDLGGIGKGYAVDRVAEVLEEWEVPYALVHGGFSSVLALSAPPGRDGWDLTLSQPADNRVLARVSAERRAFSASGVRKGDHILDPRSGLPAQHRAAAWVAVPWADGERPAAIADGLSTAFMVLPVEEITALCRSCPGLEAWMVESPEQGGGPGGMVHVGTGPEPDGSRQGGGDLGQNR